MRPQRQLPDTSYSYTSCRTTERRPHGAADTGYHEGSIIVRKAAHQTDVAADVPVQPLNRIIGAEVRPVFAGEIAVGQRLINAILHLFGGLL